MVKFDVKNLVWTEKYRPDKIDGIVGDFREKLKAYLKNPLSIPNFIFYSKSPGCGKTTSGKAIIKELGCDSLIINSSDDRNIETVRDRVKQFAMTMGTKDGLKRCVFLDEADGMCLSEGTKLLIGSKDNPEIKQIETINGGKRNGRRIMIPSVNINTGKIENDAGELIDSGVVDFFELELDDGRKIIASGNHPFFKEGFVECKLKDLHLDDSIIDMSDDIFYKCKICGKYINPRRQTCSIKCKDILHKQRMEGKGNPRYGVKPSKETCDKISSALLYHVESSEKKKKQSEFMKNNNPMQKQVSREKISKALTGRTVSQQWIDKGNKTKGLPERGTIEYEIYCIEKGNKKSLKHQKLKLNKNKYDNCELCGIEKTTNGDGTAGLTLHHIDRNRINHENNNLLICCSRCHYHIHQGYRCVDYKEWKIKYKDKLLNKKIILYGDKK